MQFQESYLIFVHQILFCHNFLNSHLILFIFFFKMLVISYPFQKYNALYLFCQLTFAPFSVVKCAKNMTDNNV